MGVSKETGANNVLVSLHQSLVSLTELYAILEGLDMANQVGDSSSGLQFCKSVLKPGEMHARVVLVASEVHVAKIHGLSVHYQNSAVGDLRSICKAERDRAITVVLELYCSFSSNPLSPSIRVVKNGFVGLRSVPVFRIDWPSVVVASRRINRDIFSAREGILDLVCYEHRVVDDRLGVLFPDIVRAVIAGPENAINFIAVILNDVLQHRSERSDGQVTEVGSPEPCLISWICWEAQLFSAAEIRVTGGKRANPVLVVKMNV